MDTVILLVIVVAVLVILYFLFRGSPGTSPTANGDDETVYTFDPLDDAIKPTARRRVRIVAPAQTKGGLKRKLLVDANPLPDPTGLQPSPDKGIDALIVCVIDARVRFADTLDEVYEFEPPLTFTFNYSKEDAGRTGTDANGTPKLSIITGYEADDGWKFERLPTTVNPDPATGGGTMTAQVKALHPKDPQWAGAP